MSAKSCASIELPALKVSSFKTERPANGMPQVSGQPSAVTAGRKNITTPRPLRAVRRLDVPGLYLG